MKIVILIYFIFINQSMAVQENFFQVKSVALDQSYIIKHLRQWLEFNYPKYEISLIKKLKDDKLFKSDNPIPFKKHTVIYEDLKEYENPDIKKPLKLKSPNITNEVINFRIIDWDESLKYKRELEISPTRIIGYSATQLKIITRILIHKIYIDDNGDEFLGSLYSLKIDSIIADEYEELDSFKEYFRQQLQILNDEIERQIPYKKEVKKEDKKRTDFKLVDFKKGILLGGADAERGFLNKESEDFNSKGAPPTKVPSKEELKEQGDKAKEEHKKEMDLKLTDFKQGMFFGGADAKREFLNKESENFDNKGARPKVPLKKEDKEQMEKRQKEKEEKKEIEKRQKEKEEIEKRQKEKEEKEEIERKQEMILLGLDPNKNSECFIPLCINLRLIESILFEHKREKEKRKEKRKAKGKKEEQEEKSKEEELESRYINLLNRYSFLLKESKESLSRFKRTGQGQIFIREVEEELTILKEGKETFLKTRKPLLTKKFLKSEEKRVREKIEYFKTKYVKLYDALKMLFFF